MNKRTLFLLLGLLLLPGLFAFNVSAATYYVSTSGSNYNPGTQSQPFRTIQKAVDVMQPGDTTYVRGGVYPEYVRFNRSGQSGSRITLQAYPGERPVIDGTGVSVPSWQGLIYAGTYSTNNINYITVDGFEIRDSSWYGIRVIKCHGWIVRNTIVHHTQKGGIVFHQSNDIKIQNNEVHHVGLTNGNGINVQGGSRVLMEYNYSHDNSDHYGLQIITDHPDGDTSFYYDNVVRYNRITRCKTGMYFRNNINLKIYGNVIYHNVVDGHYAGIHLGQDDGTSGSFNSYAEIFNNTFVGHVVSIYNQAFNSLEVKNNIFHAPSKTAVEMNSDARSGHVFDHNIFYGKDYSVRGPSSMYTDPRFENASGDDYRLQSSSPAVDAGTGVSYITTDCSGTSRPQGNGLDIGAYEYDQESGGSEDPVLPSPPQNFRLKQ